MSGLADCNDNGDVEVTVDYAASATADVLATNTYPSPTTTTVATTTTRSQAGIMRSPVTVSLTAA